MNLKQAKEVQHNLDTIVARPMLPLPFVWEDSSELTWMLWDEATVVLDFQVS